MIYLSTTRRCLYRVDKGQVYWWKIAVPTSPAKTGRRQLGKWVLSVHSLDSFGQCIVDGIMVTVGRWPQVIYGMPAGAQVTVPDCYSLREMAAKYPPQTLVNFKAGYHG
jgi:hypothetical protein